MRYPSSSVGGMQQRVGIARALVDAAARAADGRAVRRPGCPDALAMQEELLLGSGASCEPTVVFVTHDIDEAFFLADRVVVMQALPGRIAREIDVPFTRPRAAEVMDEPGFIERRREIADIIRVEARKSFR